MTKLAAIALIGALPLACGEDKPSPDQTVAKSAPPTTKSSDAAPSPTPHHASLPDAAPPPPDAAPPPDFGDLAVLAQAGKKWTYEVVSGRRPDRLKPVKNAPPARCEIRSQPPVGRFYRVRLICTTDVKPKTGLSFGGMLGLALYQSRMLIFDDDGVRQGMFAVGRENRIALKRNAGPFTFPKRLDKSSWKHDARDKGGRARIVVKKRKMKVLGKKRDVWFASSKYWESPKRDGKLTEPSIGADAYAPGLGPVLCARHSTGRTGACA